MKVTVTTKSQNEYVVERAEATQADGYWFVVKNVHGDKLLSVALSDIESVMYHYDD